MASESVNALSLKDFPTLCRLGVVGNLSDGRTLESFLAGDKETAEASFAALVDRHGPMVLRVCREDNSVSVHHYSRKHALTSRKKLGKGESLQP